MGIITSIWAGLMASIFGGSKFNIVGPTGALSGILAAYSIAHGMNSLPILAIVSGLFILAAYLIKLERYLIFIPASTIQGFTLGVAFIIALNQLNYALGLTGLPVHERFISNLSESLTHINNASLSTVLVFGTFLCALFLLQKFLPKIPGAIVLAPIGILLGYLSINNSIPLELITLGSKYKDIGPILIDFPQFTNNVNLDILLPAATVALVAILETMISAKIADGMTKTKHNKRKEMLGLGIANIASGFAGGLPATAALARTSLNIKTGATSSISAFISACCTIVISLLFLSFFKYIPMAVIASILVFVAIRMVEAEHFARMFRLDKKSFAIALLVAFVTIYEDPIIGILFGTAISLLLFMEKLSKGQFELIINDKDKKPVKKFNDAEIKEIKQKMDTMVYSIKGQLAYINGQSHIARFEHKLNGTKNVILRLRELYFIDVDGIEALEEIGEILEAKKKNVFLTGISPLIEKMLMESHFYQKLKKEGHVLPKTTDALKTLGYNV